MLIYLDEGERGRAGAGKITEYGGREERQVQKCKSADGRCKGGKVNDKTGRGGAGQRRVQSAEYRVRSAVSCEDRAKVQIGAELLCKGGKVRG
jgi:hypothetical protein